MSNQLKDANFNSYLEYNKTLRAWLVAFGFGGPALFIVNPTAQLKLFASPNARMIVILFLVGAGAQVIMAFANKVIAWCAYRSFHLDEKACLPVRCIARLEHWFCIDVICDLASLVTFGWSIVLVMRLFLDIN
jgi:hypothetical protein